MAVIGAIVEVSPTWRLRLLLQLFVVAIHLFPLRLKLLQGQIHLLGSRCALGILLGHLTQRFGHLTIQDLLHFELIRTL